MAENTSPLPSVDALLRAAESEVLLNRFGRSALTATLRDILSARRSARAFGAASADIINEAADHLVVRFARSQRRVFNMTGTVLHTNLGRAPLPPEAAEAAAEAMKNATTLEFDLATGRRGERDDHIRGLLCELTGAEAATVVNNNAAARDAGAEHPGAGQGGAGFARRTDRNRRRLPGARHHGPLGRDPEGGGHHQPDACRDYVEAIGPATGALMRVHQANYAIVGFTAMVPTETLSGIARHAGIPLIEDLGSGSLVDLERWGLPHEPTPRESLAAGADVVTFSGDKLLGGPQAGLIVGHKDAIAAINRNPLKRALRLDKGRLAALEVVLRMYLNPDRLARARARFATADPAASRYPGDRRTH